MPVNSVAIVGRANVGKSSLFNALCGRRIAIVDSVPGITRDRVAREIDINDRTVELVDTGGVGMESAEEIAEDVDIQIEIAIVEADLVLLVVDARHGVHPFDREIAQRLREADKRVLVVANKAERDVDHQATVEFFEFGFGDPIPVSAVNRYGLHELRDQIDATLPLLPEDEDAGKDGLLKLAIVGKRNAGKSTLINHLSQEQRVVVSELAGTTRDSVDVRIHFEGTTPQDDIIAIDTAGVRKRKQLKESVDFYSQVRTKRSIERADVVLMLIDATLEITKVDKQLADLVISNHKPCIIGLNKVDLLPKDVADEEYTRYVWHEMPGLRFAPLVMLSAQTGENVMPTLDVVEHLREQSGMRVKTSDLNDIITELTSRRRPPSRSNRFGKILYATQVDTHPPTIALFVNDAADINDHYKRYLSNQLRDALPYSDIPIKFVTRRRDNSSRMNEDSQ